MIKATVVAFTVYAVFAGKDLFIHLLNPFFDPDIPHTDKVLNGHMAEMGKILTSVERYEVLQPFTGEAIAFMAVGKGSYAHTAFIDIAVIVPGIDTAPPAEISIPVFGTGHAVYTAGGYQVMYVIGHLEIRAVFPSFLYYNVSHNSPLIIFSL